MRASDPHIGSLKWQDPSPIGPGVVVSAFVHAGIIALGLVLWQNPPAFTPEDVIPVAIVADTPSVIGPETQAETVRTGEENSEMVVADSPVADTAPAPEPKSEVSPPPPAAPTPQPVQKAPPPKPAPASVQKAAPTPTAPAKASPQKAALPTQVAPSLPSKANTKSKVQAKPEPAFDFAAASAAASGANSGGRTAPKLAAAGQSAKQGRAGGGTLLAGDLESALRAQIYQCWRRPAENSPRLIVTLQIELTPDGNLAKAPTLIRPSSEAGADNKLLVAIEAARRAVQQCAPFSLPADRHTQWRLVNFDFDARKADRP
jgi:outer membrane biosynthesis protein TonB